MEDGNIINSGSLSWYFLDMDPRWEAVPKLAQVITACCLPELVARGVGAMSIADSVPLTSSANLLKRSAAGRASMATMSFLSGACRESRRTGIGSCMDHEGYCVSQM